ncbi:MAG: RNA polymerase sigma-70 factor [Acidobacteria bacterium]|nr:RNA polymerase sigma-70 factor [Acidobacteriota bacterium]
MIGEEKKVEIFGHCRPRLFGIAYRMLGTHAEAEDILQEAYLKWHQARADEIETPEAWLVTVTTRLAIDRLRKASNERETYIGPWLPEPLVVSPGPTPEEEVELASNLSMAFMVMLERLSPVERAAFLLHDVFDCDYRDVARIVGKTETASRQLIHRARRRVRTDKPRFETNERERRRLIERFTAAAHAGDERTLLALFADEAALISDGGGKATAARRVVRGKTKIAHLFAVTGRKAAGALTNAFCPINGETGLLTFYAGKLFAATLFDIADGKIAKVYRVMNPDKLESLAALAEISPADRMPGI